jgi:hypothetical protein
LAIPETSSPSTLTEQQAGTLRDYLKNTQEQIILETTSPSTLTEQQAGALRDYL